MSSPKKGYTKQREREKDKPKRERERERESLVLCKPISLPRKGDGRETERGCREENCVLLTSFFVLLCH
ncbi:hypothetical protein HYC85_000360 [Camellia sinensis]|uniref:Uncharacterized protein n=1 Tax=Camellia sinensis TaxID=4442 RepID=A0A7J7I3M2_CAMSI|nr:hypothetical protein HYC85_000360 [Camellia sinensis]